MAGLQMIIGFPFSFNFNGELKDYKGGYPPSPGLGINCQKKSASPLLEGAPLPPLGGTPLPTARGQFSKKIG